MAIVQFVQLGSFYEQGNSGINAPEEQTFASDGSDMPNFYNTYESNRDPNHWELMERGAIIG